MREYHHLGIPTETPREDEVYLERFDMWVSGFDKGSYGIEWMRFGPNATVPEIVRTLPHVAFKVGDLQAELEGKHVLIEPNSPSPGVTVAFILDNGAPIEFLEFGRPE